MFSCGQIYIDIQLFSLIFHAQQNSIFKAIRQLRWVIRFAALRQYFPNFRHAGKYVEPSKNIKMGPRGSICWVDRANICLSGVEWSIVRAWLLYWDFIADLLKCDCLKSCDCFFVHGFEEDRPNNSEKWAWMKSEVVGVVCGATFGEERVNNSVPLFSRVLVAFSVSQI